MSCKPVSEYPDPFAWWVYKIRCNEGGIPRNSGFNIKYFLVDNRAFKYLQNTANTAFSQLLSNSPLQVLEGNLVEEIARWERRSNPQRRNIAVQIRRLSDPDLASTINTSDYGLFVDFTA